MEKFCNENPYTDFKSVKKLIKKELKKDMFDVFEYFEENPVAVGSIAQVHKAKLKSGEFVAVKVQHPQIINQTKGDIFVVSMSCWLGEWAFPDCKLQWINKDFKNNMLKEIDFEIEYNNIKKAQRLFSKEKNIIVPKVYKEYSSKRILTMSFEEGKSICDVKFRKENNIKVSEISNLLNHVFNKQIFKYGFVHADPHQGNLFIRKEYNNSQMNNKKYKEKPVLKLILLDFGLFVDLDKKFITDYTNLWRGIFIQDFSIIEKACIELGVKEHKVFTSMITGKEFDDVMNKHNKDPDERLRIKKGNFINFLS